MAASSPRETETKFRLEDRAAFEARLGKLGADRLGTESEVNLLFDDERESLRARGCALRLRTTESGALLTFKGKTDVASGVKSRIELESAVESPGAVAGVLEALGYRPWFRYDKRRTTWRLRDARRPVVVVDETPLGLFAEIEGEEEAVRALAAELGIPESAFIADSYVALYLRARRENPALPEDMVFFASGP